MTAIDEPQKGLDLSPEAVESRRTAPEPHQQVVFRVDSLWGTSDAKGMEMPLNERESIQSGRMTIMLDANSPGESNIGVIRYDDCSMRIRYGVQAVFPGLYDLVTGGKYDLGLLAPIRAVATDMCEVLPDFSGWRALGTMDFLPGSLWAGASGG